MEKLNIDKLIKVNNIAREELDNQLDMLQGNINRMCSSKQVDDLNKHFNFIVFRLITIYKLCNKRILLLQEYEKLKNIKII